MNRRQEEPLRAWLLRLDHEVIKRYARSSTKPPQEEDWQKTMTTINKIN
jgi:hypothetical protein